MPTWSKISTYVASGLGIALLVTSGGWYTTDLKLDACTAGRALDKKTYENAQKEASRLQAEDNLKKERENAKKASEADAAYGSLLDKYRANLRLYQAAQGQTRIVYVPTEAGSTEQSNRPDPGTLIPITVADADICAVNTARLKAVQDWYNGLE